MQKYRNLKTESDGHIFSSKLESVIYQILKQKEKDGRLKIEQIQDHVYLSLARIGYIPDFKCSFPNGEFFWVEAKGYEDPTWAYKKKLWKFYGPGQLHIYKGTYRNPYLDEVITPQKN